jgi:hypothetical protein
MPLGTRITDFAWPGNAASSPGLGWDGHQLWAADLFNLRSIGLTTTGVIATVTSVTLAWSTRDREKWWGLTATQIAYWDLMPPATARVVVTASSGHLSSVLPVRQGLVTQTVSGAFQVWEPGSGQYLLVRSVLPPDPSKPFANCLAFDGEFFYTCTSNATPILTKRDGQNFTIVATAAGPAADIAVGLTFDGRALWMAIGGAIDRIYQLAVQ